MAVPMVVRVVLFCTVLSLMRRGEEAAAAAADEETQTDMSAVLDDYNTQRFVLPPFSHY